MDAIFDCLMDGTAVITSQGRLEVGRHHLGPRHAAVGHRPPGDGDPRRDHATTSRAPRRTARSPSSRRSRRATPIENELDRLDILYGLGIRSSGIAYSEANTLGCGLREQNDGGLTEFGRAAVRRMNKLGIAIDISHSGDQTSMDTIDVSEKPIFITHAGARALWNTKRMKPDEVLKACADKGGVIGIEAAPHTTLTRENLRHSIESFMQHFEYCVQAGGHRPRGVRAGHAVRRPRGAAPRLRRGSCRSRRRMARRTSRRSSSWTASKTPPRSSRTSCAGW